MTANNVITDGDEPYISYTFAQPFRAERLRSLLAGAPVLTVAELAGMQADTVSLAARWWGRVLGGLGPFPDGSAEAARVLLAGWDGDLAAGSGAALLYACFQRALADALYRPLLGPDTWEWMASGALVPTVTMVRRWLANDTWELLGGPGGPGPGCGPGRGRGRGPGRGRRAGGTGAGRGARRAGGGVGRGGRVRRAGSGPVALG
jgi:acyl-homoserine lactone acylase PvdQ